MDEEPIDGYINKEYEKKSKHVEKIICEKLLE